MSGLFVIAANYEWSDVNEHIERVAISTNRVFNEIHHWENAKSSLRAFGTLRQTIESDHMFLLYKDYQKHPTIDGILNAVYDYKTKHALNPTPFLDALIKTSNWVPIYPFLCPFGYMPKPEHRRFFR